MRLHPIGIIRNCDLPSVADSEAVGESNLRWIRVGPLAVGALDTESTAPTPAAHAAAVDAVFQLVCILPSRYESSSSNVEMLHRTVEERREEFLKRLDLLEGCCEFGLRIRRSETEPAPSAERLQPAGLSDPRAYLERRRAFYAARDATTGATADVTDPLVLRLIEETDAIRDWRMLPAPPGLLRPTFLIEKKTCRAFEDLVERMRHETDDRIEEIDGPWPPYSFV